MSNFCKFSFAGNLIYVRYGEAPTTKENKYKSLKKGQSSSTLLQRPLPEEPVQTQAFNPAAVYYDQSELESTYINVEGKDRNMYERVSFSRKGTRRGSLSKHAVIMQPDATYIPMHATNPLRDRSATSLGEVNDTYATVSEKLNEKKNIDPVGAAKLKRSNEKPQPPLPYASGNDTYATVDKPEKKLESDGAKPSPPSKSSSDTYAVVNKPKKGAAKPETVDEKTAPIPLFAPKPDTYSKVNKPMKSGAQNERPVDDELNESAGLGKFTSTSALLPK